MSGTPLALLSLGVALRSATPLSATPEPVANFLLQEFCAIFITKILDDEFPSISI